MGVPVIDANCQTASEMQYESRADSFLFSPALPPTLLTAHGFAAPARRSPLEYRTRFFAARRAGILEQKRDCSQSSPLPILMNMSLIAGYIRVGHSA